MAVLIVIALFALAAVYGLFFIIFKLIALIAKKQGYKMPLIAAGIATFAVALLAGLAAYRLYKKVITPFEPIVHAVQTQHPMYGQRLYTDPTYGFSITQYDGTVFSKWLPVAGSQVLVGVDANAFMKTSDPDLPKTFAAFALVRTAVEPDTTAEQLMQPLLTQLTATDTDVQIELQGSAQTVPLGETANGSFISAVLYADQLPDEGLPAALLITVHEGQAYYFLGTSNQTDNILWNTLTSFRFAL